MKGLIFTEFIEMVEDRFGDDLVETIIDEADLPSGGAYTSVGTYSAQEMEMLVQRLSAHTGHDRSTLLRVFGKHLFGVLHRGYPHFFPPGISLFDFLASIHDYIHVEVRKLYPEAELADLQVLSRTDNQLVLRYESSRKMGDLGYGLLEGCFDVFEVDGEIQAEPITENGVAVAYTITKK